jgi:arylsulfatase A-like enzyme
MILWPTWSERPSATLRRLVPALALLFLACGGDRPSEAARDDTDRSSRLLLIGIDGVRADILAEVATPNLDRLAAAGSYTAEATTTTPSVSGPAWSSMLTGVWPEKHGVVSNDFTAPRYAEHPDFLSRIEAERPELTTVAIVDWPPLMVLPGGRALVGPDVDVREAPDGYELGWGEADARSTELAVHHIRESDPDALFVYLGNADETSHRTGSIGEEYRAAIVEADRQVGRIIEAVESRPGYGREDWLVLVSTDHGRRADGGHGGTSPEEMTTFLLVGGPAASAGAIEGPTFIVDVAVTALTHLGIPVDPAWKLDGRAVGLR